MLRYLFTYRPLIKWSCIIIILSGLAGSVTLAYLFNLDSLTRYHFFRELTWTLFPALMGIILAGSICGKASRSLHCDHCNWTGGLKDLEHNQGECPLCHGFKFSYTILRTMNSKFIGVGTQTTYRYFIIPNKIFSELKSEKSSIWPSPPAKWWKNKTGDNIKA